MYNYNMDKIVKLLCILNNSLNINKKIIKSHSCKKKKILSVTQLLSEEITIFHR